VVNHKNLKKCAPGNKRNI